MAKIITKKNKSDTEICQIIATSVTEIIRNSLNPTFRRAYFDTLQVTNSTDAQNVLQNRLLNLVDEHKLCEKKQKEKTFLENDMVLQILCSSDAINTHRRSEIISMINYLIKIDSKSNVQVKK